MKYFVVNTDQLIDLEFGNIRQRAATGDEVRKQEIKPALIPIKEPRIFIKD